MKRSSFLSGKNLLLILFGTCLLISAFSCKKSKDPENMQLMGNWLQSNGQDSIYFYVDNIGGTLFITSVITSVNYSKGGYIHYAESNSSGLADITGNTFDIILETGGSDGPVHIAGTFNPTSMVCTGTFAYYQYGATVRTNYPYTISRP